MGWKMLWYTITDSFDTDFGVHEWHGHNAFIPRWRQGVPHAPHQRPWRPGDGDHLEILDITPLGRPETWEDPPEGYPRTPPYKWWNWHDNYAAEASPNAKWVEVSDAGEAACRKRAAEAKA
jgi:predicted dithiol-disulfide oxidoreductase (DUF899 family)